MKKSRFKKRGVAWTVLIAMWVADLVLTIICAGDNWEIPATCYWCRMQREFDTGGEIFSVFAAAWWLALIVVLFYYGHKSRIVRILMDTAALCAGSYFLYLAVLTVRPEVITHGTGPAIFAIRIGLLVAFLACIMISAVIVYSRRLKKTNTEGEGCN